MSRLSRVHRATSSSTWGPSPDGNYQHRTAFCCWTRSRRIPDISASSQVRDLHSGPTNNGARPIPLHHHHEPPPTPGRISVAHLSASPTKASVHELNQSSAFHPSSALGSRERLVAASPHVICRGHKFLLWRAQCTERSVHVRRSSRSLRGGLVHRWARGRWRGSSMTDRNALGRRLCRPARDRAL